MDYGKIISGVIAVITAVIGAKNGGKNIKDGFKAKK